MNFLQTYAQAGIEQKDERETFISSLGLEQIKEETLLGEAFTHNKIVIYKNEAFVGNGFHGEIKQLSIVIKTGKLAFKTEFSMTNEENSLQKVPEFEFLVFIENNVYIIFRNNDQNVEIYKFHDSTEIYTMILSNSMESHNTIFTFCLYDKKRRCCY